MESKNVLKSQSGFTLIELVAVIVVLGILAVVAVPRFINLQEEAAEAAVEGVAGALSSASALNYAACMAGSTECEEVANCTAVEALLIEGLPTGYSITAAAVAEGDAELCTLTGEQTKTATFMAIGTSP